jgi:hypothetical protein
MTEKGTWLGNTEIHTNQRVKQVCPMSPVSFNIHFDEVTDNGKYFKYFKIGNVVLNIIIFGDNQAIFSESENDLQRAVDRPENIAKWL